MKVMIVGSSPQLDSITKTIVAMGHSVVHATEATAQALKETEADIAMSLEQAKKTFIPEPVTCALRYELQKMHDDHLSMKAIRNESIVRNPCLPGRWKKGSKR